MNRRKERMMRLDSGGRGRIGFSAFLEISLSQKSKSLDMGVNNVGKKKTEKKPSR